MRALGLDGGKELGLSPAFCTEAQSKLEPGPGAGRVPAGEQGAEMACMGAQLKATSSNVRPGDGPSLLSSAPSSSALLSVSIAIVVSACKTDATVPNIFLILLRLRIMLIARYNNSGVQN